MIRKKKKKRKKLKKKEIETKQFKALKKKLYS